MSIDERIKVGNILYIIDEEQCELFERVDRIEGDMMITNDCSWYLSTLGKSWHIKNVVSYADQPDERTVSLEKCAKIIRSWCPLLTENGDHFKVAKLVLDEAGVKYVD